MGKGYSRVSLFLFFLTHNVGFYALENIKFRNFMLWKV